MEYQKQTARILQLLLGLLLALPLTARAVDNLFETEVAVTDQTAAVRAAAFRTGLAEVITRLTGDAATLNDAAARQLLESPAALVQQYRYYTDPTTSPPALRLWARYDGDAIRRALQPQATYTVESNATLVWLAVEDRGRRYIVSSAGDGEVHDQVSLAARQRGLDLLFPLMDLEDQARVRFHTLWDGDFGQVMAASARYNTPAILVGRLARTPAGGWSARWHLDAAGRVQAWTDSHAGLREVVAQGVDDVAQQLASQQQSGGGRRYSGLGTEIGVSGVNTLAAYAHVTRYLEALSTISALEVRELAPGSVRYAVYNTDGLQGLARTITIGTVLEPEPGGYTGSFRLRQ